MEQSLLQTFHTLLHQLSTCCFASEQAQRRISVVDHACEPQGRAHTADMEDSLPFYFQALLSI